MSMNVGVLFGQIGSCWYKEMLYKKGSWKVPINPQTIQTPLLSHLDLYTPKHTTSQLHHMGANVYTLPFKQQQLKYMHQAFFNPLIHTLIKAINIMNNWKVFHHL
jgi:hypothetical protein